MSLIQLLQKKSEKIIKLKDELIDLQHDLEGAEVNYNGKTAIVMDVDWREKQVLLNYDDVNMEWISFQE